MRQSFSWRITWPIRFFGAIMLKITFSTLRKLYLLTIRFLNRHYGVKVLAVRLYEKIPFSTSISIFINKNLITDTKVDFGAGHAGAPNLLVQNDQSSRILSILES